MIHRPRMIQISVWSHRVETTLWEDSKNLINNKENRKKSQKISQENQTDNAFENLKR